MHLSIIIVSWNVKEDLGNCLKSIEENKPRKEFEIIVDYFAGKDEICDEREITKFDGTLIKIIAVIDIYGANDRELYCTLIIRTSDRNEIRRFSASGRTCRPLLTETFSSTHSFLISDDHICRIK